VSKVKAKEDGQKATIDPTGGAAKNSTWKSPLIVPENVGLLIVGLVIVLFVKV
jgi:hypothetical protein